MKTQSDSASGSTPSFRNPLEYNAEYILIRGGTIKYSVTKKTEKVPDIYFAKYPVTNKLYRRFIRYLQDDERDLGEINPPLAFAEKLLEFAARDKAYVDYLGRDTKDWPEKLKSKQDEDRKLNGEDQPVVGVSWYASRAYCFWLSEMGRAGGEGQRAEGKTQNPEMSYRLPTEVEWERAAAGRLEDGPAREYPWPIEKGEPNENLANYYRWSVRQTTPVSRYPDGATPEGLMDMAGNVWEWQENRFENKECPEARALRSSSWRGTAEDLRCVARGGGRPVDLWDFDGFRVVFGQSSNG